MAVKRILLILIALVSVFSVSAANEASGSFTLSLLKSGTSDYGFCTASSITDQAESITDISAIEFPLGTNETKVSTSFGVYWDLFTDTNGANITITLSFSAVLDNSMNCMLYNNDSNDPMYLNYSADALVYSGYGPGTATSINPSLTFDDVMINSNNLTDRTITLISPSVYPEAAMDKFNNLSGGAVVNLTLNAPVDSTGERNFVGSEYTGYAILEVRPQ